MPVVPQAAPTNFDALVAVPGAAHLADNPPQVPLPSRYWRNRSYWTQIREALWRAYRGFCCYTCVRIEPSNAYWGSVEHFEPKSLYPARAYDWDNFRLASTVPNQSKKDHEDVLDPFLIGDGWFAIDSATLEVVPGPAAPPGRLDEIKATIARLKLSRQEYVISRSVYVDLYLQGEMTIEAVAAFNPFLAAEIDRWNLTPQPQPSSAR